LRSRAAGTGQRAALARPRGRDAAYRLGDRGGQGPTLAGRDRTGAPGPATRAAGAPRQPGGLGAASLACRLRTWPKAVFDEPLLPLGPDQPRDERVGRGQVLRALDDRD